MFTSVVQTQNYASSADAVAILGHIGKNMKICLCLHLKIILTRTQLGYFTNLIIIHDFAVKIIYFLNALFNVYSVRKGSCRTKA